MTALDKFERLESLGLWKETRSSQKKEVIVSFGDASLVLSDSHDTPLAHWALDAVEICAIQDRAVIYTPDKTGSETLEISDQTMNLAIEKVRKAMRKPRSQRGRIRIISFIIITLSFVLLGTFWLPNALADYATQAISDAKAREIGAKLMPYINQYAGQPCQTQATNPVIRKLEDRLIGAAGHSLFIADLGARYSTHLPGGIILANRTLVENFDSPEVLAGFVLMEHTLLDHKPAIRELFQKAGLFATLSFLVTGNVSDTILSRFAKTQMIKSLALPDTNVLLARFKTADISSTPFANAIGNQKLSELDPVKGVFKPILTDPEWLALQTICES